MSEGVKRDEETAKLARQVSQTLAEMLANAPDCPRGADRFDWSSDVLDELARAVDTLGQVVDRFAGGAQGDAADPVDAKVRELATAIIRQRNSLLAERPVTRRFHSAPVLPRR